MSGFADVVAWPVALAGIALLAFALWMLVGWLGAWRLNRYTPRFEDSMFSPFELDVEAEEVRFTASDGVRLHGWFLPRPGNRRVVVVMHGYRGNKTHVLGISSYLWRTGFNVLLFDFRGRGASDRAPISMGLWEVEDLAAALDWIGARVPDAAVGLLGFSMGAVVALLGGHDPRVRAIVSDSAFASQREVLEHASERNARRVFGGWIGGRRFLPVVEWWHRRWGKPPFDCIAPEAALPRLAGTPLLFIHAMGDSSVPVAQAERLYAAAPQPKDLWIARAGGHCGAYFVDRIAYAVRAAAFFDQHLAGAGTRRRSRPARNRR